MKNNRIPTKVRSPKGVKNYGSITAGKEYEVMGYEDAPEPIIGTFHIISDSRTKIFCLLKGCSHLDSKNWIVTEYEKIQS